MLRSIDANESQEALALKSGLILARAKFCVEIAEKLQESIRINRFILRHELKYMRYLVQTTRQRMHGTSLPDAATVGTPVPENLDAAL